MPGTFGNAPTDDGVTASTASSSKSGVFGRNDATTPPPAGSPGGAGVFGLTVVPGAPGVFGSCNADSGRGVQGNGPEAGVSGFSESGTGVLAHSNHGDAIQSFAHDSRRNGVFGNNDAKAPAPSGGAPAGNGVFGFTEVPNASGVCGAIPASNTKGAGVTGIGRTAGRFFGNVEVTGDLVLTGADVAEQFDVAERLNTADEVGPGTVVVLNDKGALAPCTQAYDSCVAGVVSGAGDRVPALVLDRKEYPEGREDAWRRAVAVVGKVWCRANASSRPILVGDLLTTSTTLGHAMAAVDRDAAFGAVLGKALTPLASGTGLVLVLVGLG